VSVATGGTLAVAAYLDTTVAGLDLAAGGLVDVSHGGMTVTAGMSVSSLFSALLAGRNNGLWTGTSGITSSAVAADVAVGEERAVGWLDNGDGSVTAAYAAPGDTNLDWQVDVLDASNFLSFGKFDSGLAATWLEGDFNYDRVVDVLDAADFFGTGLYDAGNYNTPTGASGIAAVPEPAIPAGLLLASAAAVALLPTSRRHLPPPRASRTCPPCAAAPRRAVACAATSRISCPPSSSRRGRRGPRASRHRGAVATCGASVRHRRGPGQGPSQTGRTGRQPRPCCLSREAHRAEQARRECCC